MMATATLLGTGAAFATEGDSLSLITTVLGLLFLPIIAGRSPLYPLNQPQWSILSELFANAVHIWLGRRLNLAVMAIFAALAWVMLLILGHIQESLNVGTEGATWLQGLWRVGFGYTAGCVLYRTRPIWNGPQLRGQWTVVGPATLFAVIVLPWVFGFSAAWSDPLAVLSFVPIVAVASCSPSHPLAQGICEWLGRMSFPLYALHYPVLRLAEAVAPRLPENLKDISFVVAVGIALVLAHFAARSPLAKGLRLGRFLQTADARPLRSSPHT